MSKRKQSTSGYEFSIEPSCKKAKPSFSSTSYENVRAKIQSLPENPDRIPLEEGPTYRLPGAIHAKIYETVWNALNVYGDMPVLFNNEARKVRIFEAYIIPIVTLFEGRVIDRPEAKLKGTGVTSGGFVEHELCVIGGVLLILIEFKKDTPKEGDLAQLLAEILAAAAENEKIPDFKNLKIHGILTNLTSFMFYNFDPATQAFSREATMMSGVKRRDFLKGMIAITNKVFSVVFTSFVEALECTLKLSTRRGENGDFGGLGSAMLSQYYPVRNPGPASKETKTTRSSTSNWEQAFRFAQEAEVLFKEHGESFEEGDGNSTKAIELLRSSALMIPRIGGSDENYDLDEKALRSEALDTVRSVYQIRLP